MNETIKTVDFGAPEKFGAHVFRVEIPAARSEPVRIIEDYGYRGLEGGIPRDEERVVLLRPIWSGIADIARREFNGRLKAAKIPTGRSPPTSRTSHAFAHGGRIRLGETR